MTSRASLWGGLIGRLLGTIWRYSWGVTLVVLALSDKSRVVGFVTAITDGVSCAYIPHLEVLPEWQGDGIGTELMRRMMLKLETIRAIDVICDEEVRGFYERLGFKAWRGMIIRKPSESHWVN